MEAVLECEVCANPEVNVAWLKDNSPLATSRKAMLEADGGKHRLLIKKAECADSGLYTIIASNIHGTTSCSAPLTVNSAPASLPPTTPDGSVMSYGPIFREKLRDTELQEGTDFRVCVIIEGEPKPSVKFYKGDEEISSTGRVRYNKENDECYELIIDKVKKEDSGKYSCVTKSSAGQNVSACDIGVTSSKVFVEIHEDPDRTATPENIEDNMHWSKDGKEVEVESSERFKVSIDESEDTVSLVFQHVTPDDAGLYTCVASTSSGKISCSAELTVQGGLLRDPEAPKLSSAIKKVDAKEGSSALLEMTATGFPKPVITWTKDGEELKMGDKYVMLQEDDESFTMAIKNLTQDDTGKYCAEAINDMGKDDITYDLKVTSPPKILKQMEGTEVMLDEDIEFCVEVDGSPEPTVSWCKDGQALVPSERIIITSEDKVQKLVIKKAKVENSGNYSCIIKNENGSQGSYGVCKVNSPAKFIKGLNDITINAGEDAKLSVAISGDPSPVVKWKKDGKDIETRITEKKENDSTYTLTIKKTKTEDSGEYVCEISNEHGKDTTKSNLTVKEKSTKPSFKKGLKDIEVTENEDIKLEVTVDGSPKPTLKWSKDGNELKIDGKHVQVKKEESEDTETVIIRKTTTEDSGTYSCTVTNTEGSETTTSEVVVKEEETAPSITKKLEDISVTEGETVEFSVKFSGKKTKVIWSKDDVELKIDNKHFEYKKEEAEDSLTLVLNNAKPGDSGKYTCNISNAVGTVETSSNLSVSGHNTKGLFEHAFLCNFNPDDVP
nr:obscurin-like [Parasteatoda tepidariorum]